MTTYDVTLVGTNGKDIVTVQRDAAMSAMALKSVLDTSFEWLIDVANGCTLRVTEVKRPRRHYILTDAEADSIKNALYFGSGSGSNAYRAFDLARKASTEVGQTVAHRTNANNAARTLARNRLTRRIDDAFNEFEESYDYARAPYTREEYLRAAYIALLTSPDAKLYLEHVRSTL